MFIIFATVIFSILITATWLQVRYWRNSITLFQHALEVTNDNALTFNNLGAALAFQGKRDEAISCYVRALRLNPNYVKAHNRLGILLAKQGKSLKPSLITTKLCR